MKQHKKGEMPEITREVYKSVKKFDREQFTGFCTDLYKFGYQDGRDSVTVVSVEDIYEVIAAIKGIGPKKLEEIKSAITEKFGKEDKSNGG